MSGIRSLTRYKTIKGYASDGSAPIYVDSDDNRVKLIPTGGGTTEVILQEAGGVAAYETLITTRVLTLADSGKTFGLKLVGGFTVTLPALSTAAGFHARFIVEVSPTTAYIIASAEGDNLVGVAAAADGLAVTVQGGFVADSANFVANLAVIGDTVDITAVGVTGWSAQGTVAVGGGISFPG
jgi:hypothetical protein